MNIATFLEHWSITENPFRAEEARHDPVFARLGPVSHPHPDFEKIVGDLWRPSTSIVFGEKGSGKTAIRLQLAERIAAHNAQNPEAKVLLIAYDDLNPPLDRFTSRQAVKGDGGDVVARLKKIRLVDHMDAILHVAVSSLIDRLLRRPTSTPATIADASDPEADRRILRRADPEIKRDLQLLQALYDRGPDEVERSRALRRLLRTGWNTGAALWRMAAMLGWIVPAGAAALAIMYRDQWLGSQGWFVVVAVAAAAWLIVLFKHLVWDRWRLSRLARRLARQMPTVPRNPETLTACLALLPPAARESAVMPLDDSDEHRYASFARLKRVGAALGYRGCLVIVDRVDEPTLVSGVPERMRAVVWPLLNNKFLQQDGLGIKLLLPIELRYELFRESQTFFQEARLDKQNLVERLTWTGATLYDLCNARLAACRPAGAEPMTLTDLFDADVSRQDVVDALDQMHQPRDAFKMLYQCVQEHCSNMTEEQPQWRIPRLVLEGVRRQQSDRVQMFSRGVRPA